MATIGNEFKFSVYARRWGHNDTYRLILLADGWDFRYISMNGKCDQRGEPYLIKNLNHDCIKYPSGLQDGLEWLHNEHMELSNDEMQAGLDRLAEWVSTTERAVPKGEPFTGLW